MQDDSAEIKRILDFWFGTAESGELGKHRALWFSSSTDTDEYIKAEFGDIYQQAIAGQCEHWAMHKEGALALMVLYDQFSRNIYRNDSRAFAQDEKALALANQVLETGYDKEMLTVQRIFFYLPFEHSESVVDQEKSVGLFVALGDQDFLKYALAHRDTIVRFGRFPSRNKLLDRESTPEEIKFLQAPYF